MPPLPPPAFLSRGGKPPPCRRCPSRPAAVQSWDPMRTPHCFMVVTGPLRAARRPGPWFAPDPGAAGTAPTAPMASAALQSRRRSVCPGLTGARRTDRSARPEQPRATAGTAGAPQKCVDRGFGSALGEGRAQRGGPECEASRSRGPGGAEQARLPWLPGHCTSRPQPQGPGSHGLLPWTSPAGLLVDPPSARASSPLPARMLGRGGARALGGPPERRPSQP